MPKSSKDHSPTAQTTNPDKVEHAVNHNASNFTAQKETCNGETCSETEDIDVNGNDKANVDSAMKYRSISGPYVPGLSKSEVLSIYAQWHDYDEALNSTDYQGPLMAAELVNEYLKDKNSLVLDLAAGTGLVGVHLKSFGFENLEALDPSDMLNVAKRRKLYNKYHSYLFGPTEKSRSAIEDGTYDCVVSCGAYGENHLPVSSLDESLRILRTGGFCIIAMREAYLEEVAAYRGILEPHLKQLESSGQCRILLRETRANYFVEKEGALFVFQKSVS